ncbi:MAG: hypothetical protein WCK52_11460 [Betaproteobacteria bacterium]
MKSALSTLCSITLSLLANVSTSSYDTAGAPELATCFFKSMTSPANLIAVIKAARSILLFPLVAVICMICSLTAVAASLSLCAFSAEVTKGIF